MVWLGDETGETVHLAVLHGGTTISVAANQISYEFGRLGPDRQ